MLRLLAPALLTLLALTTTVHAQTISINGTVTLETLMSPGGPTLNVTGTLPLIGTIPGNASCAASGSVTVSNNIDGGISIDVSGSFQNQSAGSCTLRWGLLDALGYLEADLVVPASSLPVVPVVFALETPSLSTNNESHTWRTQFNATRGPSEKFGFPVAITGDSRGSSTNEFGLEVGTGGNLTGLFRSSVLTMLLPDDQLTLSMGQIEGEYRLSLGDPPVTLNETIVYSATAVPGSLGSSVASLGRWGLAMLVLGIVIGIQLRVRRK